MIRNLTFSNQFFFVAMVFGYQLYHDCGESGIIVELIFVFEIISSVQSIGSLLVFSFDAKAL